MYPGMHLATDDVVICEIEFYRTGCTPVELYREANIPFRTGRLTPYVCRGCSIQNWAEKHEPPSAKQQHRGDRELLFPNHNNFLVKRCDVFIDYKA